MQKILIIDDDEMMRAMLTALLEEEKLEVTNCSNGKEAFEILARTRFAVIVVDIFLPDLSGIEFIERIQMKKITTPIVIITGSAQFELARQAIRLGVYDYLIKPFKNVQFLQIIHNALEQDKLNQERVYLDKQKKVYQQELERKVTEKVSQLKETESKYQNLVEQSLMGVYIIQDNVFKYINSKLGEIFDADRNTLIDKLSLLDFAVEDQRGLVENHLRRISKGELLTETFRFQAKTSRGEFRILEVWSGLIVYQGSNAIEGIVLDVTEQHNSKIRERQLELELLNEHKLAAIGQLAAGISHNLNTPISIIQANAELLKLRYSEVPEIDKILNQTKRMAELINTILVKGKKDQANEFVKINLNELLRRELDFFNANLYYKHHIEKEFNFAENLPEFEAIYSDFSQSIMHIVQNAVDAMYKAPTRKLTIDTRLENSTIILSIADTGRGIPQEIQSRIFDPFFTTKPISLEQENDIHQPQGTGLGLSLVYNLLSPYKVKIDFNSEEHKGTTFTLKIPTQP